MFNTGLYDASSAVVSWVVCSFASYYRFQLQTPDSSLERKGSRVRKSPLLVHSLSIDKTLAQLPCSTLQILSTLRPQANVLGISEQTGAPEVLCAGPTNVWTRPDLHQSNSQVWVNSQHWAAAMLVSSVGGGVNLC